MKLTKLIHKNVLPNGTFSDKSGAVITTGSVRMGKGEGCSLDGCHCSDGYYITILMPLKNGKVEGMKVEFENKKEMNVFLKNHLIDN